MAFGHRGSATPKPLIARIGLGLIALFAMVQAHSRQTNELHDALQLKPDLEHGGSLYATCAACHQSHGGGNPDSAVPSIAGQHYQVVIEQLANFRDAARWDPRMSAFTAQHHLAGPQDLADVAAYIAALPTRPSAEVGPGDRTALGGPLYNRSCQSCHGARGEGDASQRVPRLDGQQFGYLVRRIRAMASGGRPAASWDHTGLFTSLSDDDIVGVADYLSRINPAQEPEP
jgi:cytochrome c553